MASLLHVPEANVQVVGEEPDVGKLRKTNSWSEASLGHRTGEHSWRLDLEMQLTPGTALEDPGVVESRLLAVHDRRASEQEDFTRVARHCSEESRRRMGGGRHLGPVQGGRRRRRRRSRGEEQRADRDNENDESY